MSMRFLKESELEKKKGLTRYYIEQARNEGCFPSPIRITGEARRFYDESEIDLYLQLKKLGYKKHDIMRELADFRERQKKELFIKFGAVDKPEK